MNTAPICALPQNGDSAARGSRPARAEVAWTEAVRRRPELAGLREIDDVVRLLTELETNLANTARQHTQATQEFDDRVRQLRMLRTGTLSGILSKTVRGAARAAGKQARFVVEGGATEIVVSAAQSWSRASPARDPRSGSRFC